MAQEDDLGNVWNFKLCPTRRAEAHFVSLECPNGGARVQLRWGGKEL